MADTPANVLGELRGLSTNDLRLFYRRFVDVQGSELAAALAYRLAVGLFPFLIFVVGISAVLLQSVGGDEPARTAVERLDTLLSEPMAAFLEGRLGQLAGTSAVLPVAGGALATVWTATLGGLSIIRHLNSIHGRKDSRSRAGRLGMGLLVGGLAGFGALLAFSILLLGSMNPRGIAGGLGLEEELGLAISLLRWPLAFAVLAASAGVIYHLAPAREGRIWEVSLGALVFAIAWTVSSGVLVLYIGSANSFTATYGTLTGVVAILIWVYLASLAFVVGAIIDAEFESRNG